MVEVRCDFVVFARFGRSYDPWVALGVPVKQHGEGDMVGAAPHSLSPSELKDWFPARLVPISERN